MKAVVQICCLLNVKEDIKDLPNDRVSPHNKPDEWSYAPFTEIDSSSLGLIKLSARLMKATGQEIITITLTEKGK